MRKPWTLLTIVVASMFFGASAEARLFDRFRRVKERPARYQPVRTTVNTATGVTASVVQRAGTVTIRAAQTVRSACPGGVCPRP